MRRIGIVTAARSDYGIYLPVLNAIDAAPDLDLLIYATGMHLAPEFGLTITEIETDGFRVHERIDTLLSSDTPASISKAMGLGQIGFAQVFQRQKPDLLLVLGDRFEMHAAGLAALPFKIPVAHIHGGEITEGAFDDALRHSLTKLSHLHFVATETYGRRIIQLGEESWRVAVTGSPTLDRIRTSVLPGKDELARRFGLVLEPAPLLVTFHPVTLEYERTEYYCGELLAALKQIDRPTVFTLPNADTAGRLIINKVRSFAGERADDRVIDNFGPTAYLAMMQHAAVMVGNSSSGIIEAASFRLPVVNIGRRQHGRIRPDNVIDVGYAREDITGGIRHALDSSFRVFLKELRNPYGDGHAAKRIVETIRTVTLDDRLVIKSFNDIQQAVNS